MRGNARLQPRARCVRMGLCGGPECGVGTVCGCACVHTCRRCPRVGYLCTSTSACAPARVRAWSGRLGQAWGLSGCSPPGSPLHCSEGGAPPSPRLPGSNTHLPEAPAQSHLCPLPPAATGCSLLEAELPSSGVGTSALAHLLSWRTWLLGSGWPALNISSASFCEPQFPHL